MNNPIKRPSELNQQVAKSVRPQMPRDGSADGVNQIHNKMPPGYVGVWSYEDRGTKNSGIQRGVGRKVY